MKGKPRDVADERQYGYRKRQQFYTFVSSIFRVPGQIVAELILESKKVDSKSELVEKLRNCQTNTILLGDDSQQSKEFVLITIVDVHRKREFLNIGLLCEGHGLKPQFELYNSNNAIVGYNRSICLITVEKSDIVKEIVLNSLFIEYRIMINRSLILVICEVEIYCINKDFTIRWHVNTNIITSYEITEESVLIRTEDELKKYSLLDGSEYYCL